MDWETAIPRGLDAGLAGWSADWSAKRGDAGDGEPDVASTGARTERRKADPGTIRKHCGLRFPGMLYAAVMPLPWSIEPEGSGHSVEPADGEPVRAFSDADFDPVRRQAGIVRVLPIAAMPSDKLANRSAVAVVARGAALARKGLAALHAAPGAEPPADLIEEPYERCAAQWRHGRLRLWLPTWDIAFYRAAVGQVAGLSEDRIEVCTVGAGSEAGIAQGIVAALALARALEPAPVQVACYRPANGSVAVMIPPPRHTSPS